MILDRPVDFGQRRKVLTQCSVEINAEDTWKSSGDTGRFQIDLVHDGQQQ